MTMPDRSVEISTSGRGGTIYYREGAEAATFDWEFASSPALALLFGAHAEHWDARYPWAAGRQAEIFQFVAQDVARQKAPGHFYELDLPGGTITILDRTR
jgi:hypothetical protein